MPLALSVHSATAGDENEVTALWKACGLTTDYNDPAEDFLFAIGKPNSDILIGKTLENKIAGSVMVGHDGHRGWVYYVAADPKHRNQGIGRHMIKAAEEWLKTRNVVKIMLLVRENNMQAIDFYRRIGYETTPRTIMQKWLRKPPNVQ